MAYICFTHSVETPANRNCPSSKPPKKYGFYFAWKKLLEMQRVINLDSGGAPPLSAVQPGGSARGQRPAALCSRGPVPQLKGRVAQLHSEMSTERLAKSKKNKRSLRGAWSSLQF